MCFLELRRQCGVSQEVRQGAQGASHMAPGKSGLHVRGEGAPAAAKSLQSCPTLCNPIDSSPLASSVPGILQARILEWVAIPFSRGRGSLVGCPLWGCTESDTTEAT